MPKSNVTVKLNEPAIDSLEREIAERMATGRLELSCPACGAAMTLTGGEGTCPSCGQPVRVGSIS